MICDLLVDDMSSDGAEMCCTAAVGDCKQSGRENIWRRGEPTGLVTEDKLSSESLFGTLG